MTNGALDGITVIEVANWVAVPSCAALMADMGARVVKIEPLAGDGMRGKLRQPVLAEGAPRTDFPFHLDNRGKLGVAVDIGDERGAALVRELAGRADVFLTNLLPGRLTRFGLGPDVLRADNPRLVYGLVTGYGSVGEEADRIAFDLTAFFGRGGIMSLIGEPGEPPPAFRAGQGDHPTGLALLSAVLAALLVRERTGEGQVVETALLRAAAWTIGCDVSVALVDRQQPNKRRRDEAISPLNTRYRCKDDAWINVIAHDQGGFGRFCDAMGRPELATDEKFATPMERFRNAREIIGIFDEMFASERYEYWAPRLAVSGLIWSKVQDLPDLVDDPQARAMEMYAEIDHPIAGPFETLNAPFTLSGTPTSVRGPAPEVGEHTAAALDALGVDTARIAELATAGVLGGVA